MIRTALVLAFGILMLAPVVRSEEKSPGLRRITPDEAREIDGIFDAYDPWESLNRRFYRFNSRFDRYVFLPAVRGYEFVLPSIARTGIANVVRTVDDVFTIANSILQLKPKRTGVTLGRVLTNLSVGVVGLWDAASHFGIARYEEDFGQTLGHYRVPPGPYLVVPVLGPSSVRDASGGVIERIPLTVIGVPPFWVSPVEATVRRAENPFRYGEIGPPFEYDLVRFVVLENRRLLVED